MASWTSTPPARTSQRLPSGEASVVAVVGAVLMGASWSKGWIRPPSADGDDAVVDPALPASVVEPSLLRAHGVLRIQCGLDTRIDDADAGQGGGVGPRRTRGGGVEPAASGKQCAHSPGDGRGLGEGELRAGLALVHRLIDPEVLVANLEVVHGHEVRRDAHERETPCGP